MQQRLPLRCLDDMVLTASKNGRGVHGSSGSVSAAEGRGTGPSRRKAHPEWSRNNNLLIQFVVLCERDFRLNLGGVKYLRDAGSIYIFLGELQCRRRGKCNANQCEGFYEQKVMDVDI